MQKTSPKVLIKQQRDTFLQPAYLVIFDILER